MSQQYLGRFHTVSFHFPPLGDHYVLGISGCWGFGREQNRLWYLVPMRRWPTFLGSCESQLFAGYIHICFTTSPSYLSGLLSWQWRKQDSSSLSQNEKRVTRTTKVIRESWRPTQQVMSILCYFTDLEWEDSDVARFLYISFVTFLNSL